MIRNTQESFDAKAKGEKFQKDLVALIQEVLPEHKDVIVSSPMSAHGEDIQILTPEADITTHIYCISKFGYLT